MACVLVPVKLTSTLLVALTGSSIFCTPDALIYEKKNFTLLGLGSLDEMTVDGTNTQ